MGCLVQMLMKFQGAHFRLLRVLRVCKPHLTHLNIFTCSSQILNRCDGIMQGAPVNDAIAEANNLLVEVDAVV
jgi:hypothetical protein